MRKKEYLGIEWTGRHLKIARIVTGDGKPVLDVRAVLPVQEISDAHFIQEVQSALRGCQPTQTVLYIARSNVIVRYLELPSLNRREIRDMIGLQLERHLPFAPSEMYYDFVSYAAEKQGYSRIVLAAISKRECDKILKLLSACGLAPDLLTISSWGALAAYQASTYYNTQATGHTLLMDTDYNQTDLIVLQGQSILFVRSISHTPDFLDANKQDSFLQQMVSELTHTIHSINREYGIKLIQTVFLGQTLRPVIKSLKSHFAESTTVAVLQEYTLSDRDQKYTQGRHTHSFLPFAGMRVLSTIEHVNLLPTSLQQESRRRTTQRERMLAFILAAAFCAILIGGAGLHFLQRYTYVKTIEHELAHIDPEARKVTNIIRRINSIGEIKHKQVLPLVVLSELYQIFPQNMYITEFDYDAARGLSIRGIAKTISQVSDLLVVLQQSPHFKAAEIKYAKQKTIKGVEQVGFEIVCPYGGEREA